MDWNNSLKNADLKLISLAGPELGFLSIFIGLLWPDTEINPWEQVRARTEKLINQKIAEEVRKRVTQTIKGLGGVVKLYNVTLKEKIDPVDRREQFKIANTQFVHDILEFQEESYELLLLPLFMQCANMHLVLINHALQLDPKVLDFKPDDRKEFTTQLNTLIDKYTAYARQIIAKGPPIEGVDPTTEYQQQIMIGVGDYLTLWPYLKSDGKKPPAMPLPREVFSQKFGVPSPVSPDNEPRGDGYFPKPPNKKPIRIKIWGQGDGRLTKFEGWYEGDDTSKPGDIRGGYEQRDAAQIDVDLTKRHIVEMTVYLGTGNGGVNVDDPYFQDPFKADFVRGLSFRLDDGSTHMAGSTKGRQEPWGNPRAQGTTFQVPEDHYTSSFNVISLYDDPQRGRLHNDLVRTIYFGFKLKEEVFK